MKLKVTARHEEDDQSYVLQQDQVDDLGLDVENLWIHGVIRIKLANGWIYHLTMEDEPSKTC